MPDQFDPNATRRMDDVPGSSGTYSNQSFDAGYGSGQQTVIIRNEKPTYSWLVAVNGPRPGRIFPLDPKATGIGRDAENEIVLDDPTASRQHAKIKREPDDANDKIERYYLYDLASGNGVYVNDQKIVRVVLQDGDRIKIGEMNFVFKTIEEQSAA